MNKLDEEFLHSFAEPTCPDPAFGKTVSDPGSHIKDFHIEDQRVARLLVLLQQLDESAGGLEALPEPELSEVVSSAIRLCGFVDPIEARDVIATVLDAIEMQDPIPKVPRLGSALVPGD